jgi:hypothetical protein
MSIPPKENITLCKMQHAKSQYTAFHGSMAHQAFQKRNGIDGKKYIPQHTEHCTRVTDPPSQSLPSNLPHIFSTFHDLPSIPTDYTINAFMALNNKEDTLTQSQMLKASDAASFIKAQQSKIQGLQHMDVFEYHSIHNLPQDSHLLSSIWSYCCKRCPNGELIKHKARICVDGSQQLYGHDYWETYAPVVTWSTAHLILLDRLQWCSASAVRR